MSCHGDRLVNNTYVFLLFLNNFGVKCGLHYSTKVYTMVGCSVLGCQSRSESKNPEISFHVFPFDPVIRQIWINATGRTNWVPSKFARICSIHFGWTQIVQKNKKRGLIEDAVPVAFVHKLHSTSTIKPLIMYTAKRYLECPENSVSKQQCLTFPSTSKCTSQSIMVDTAKQHQVFKTRNVYLDDPEADEEYEVQEEWLSDGILTDDEYQIKDNDKTDSNLGSPSHDEAVLDTDEGNRMEADFKMVVDGTDQNIEDTLNDLDSKNDMPEGLDAFLIRKTDTKLKDTKSKIKEEKARKEIEDDGNDTDDLLRLLGDDQQSKKKVLKVVKKEKVADDGTSEDDEFAYGRNKSKPLKSAKNASVKKVPSKAVPENMSDSDMTDAESSEEGTTLKRIFGIKNEPPTVKTRSTSKKATSHTQDKANNKNDSPKLSTPKGILKTSNTKTETKPLKSVEIKIPAPFKPAERTRSLKQTADKSFDDKDLKTEELEEIIDGEEFLEEEDFELDEEEFDEESNADNFKKQRIMRPEMMDEEVPSDEDSGSEDGSIYDELPSSDSDDYDDWFTLDIRSETATDYLPLLGGSARSLLLAEKRRTMERVNTLRSSLTALTDSARRQADSLRHAAIALAEIEDTLRTA